MRVNCDCVVLISDHRIAQRQRVEQHRKAIEAAKAAGVSLIAYASILNADTSAMALATGHRATEQILREIQREYPHLPVVLNESGEPMALVGIRRAIATRHGTRRPAGVRMEVRVTHRLALAAAAEHRPSNLCARSLGRSGPAQCPKISMNSFVMKKSAARTITDPRTTAWVVDRPTPSVPPVVVRPL